jgi:hypothetical protein
MLACGTSPLSPTPDHLGSSSHRRASVRYWLTSSVIEGSRLLHMAVPAYNSHLPLSGHTYQPTSTVANAYLAQGSHPTHVRRLFFPYGVVGHSPRGVHRHHGPYLAANPGSVGMSFCAPPAFYRRSRNAENALYEKDRLTSARLLSQPSKSHSPVVPVVPPATLLVPRALLLPGPTKSFVIQPHPRASLPPTSTFFTSEHPPQPIRPPPGAVRTRELPDMTTIDHSPARHSSPLSSNANGWLQIAAPVPISAASSTLLPLVRQPAMETDALGLELRPRRLLETSIDEPAAEDYRGQQASTSAVRPASRTSRRLRRIAPPPIYIPPRTPEVRSRGVRSEQSLSYVTSIPHRCGNSEQRPAEDVEEMEDVSQASPSGSVPGAKMQDPFRPYELEAPSTGNPEMNVEHQYQHVIVSHEPPPVRLGFVPLPPDTAESANVWESTPESLPVALLYHPFTEDNRTPPPPYVEHERQSHLHALTDQRASPQPSLPSLCYRRQNERGNASWPVVESITPFRPPTALHLPLETATPYGQLSGDASMQVDAPLGDMLSPLVIEFQHGPFSDWEGTTMQCLRAVEDMTYVSIFISVPFLSS